MYKQAEKSKNRKGKAVDDSVAQNKSNGKQGFEFVDNRPEVMSQRKLKETGNRTLLGASAQLKSKEHTHGCGCPSCTNSHQPLQTKKVLHSGTVQRYTTVSIKDNCGENAVGKSGNESSTRNTFAKWPDLKNSFEKNVHPKDMPKLDEDGKDTGEKYSRNGYMCAEPNALSYLLHKYNYVKHPLNSAWLAGIEFPELAIDNKTGQKIKPCPVCSQWVSDNAPMKISALDGGSFTNQAQLENEKKLALEEHLRQEQQAARLLKKERLAQGRENAKKVSEAKSEVIKELRTIDAAIIFALIDPIPKKEAEKWGINGKKKKLDTKKLKDFTDDCILTWIMGLKESDIDEIEKYKDFKDNSDFKNEFKEWAAKNLK
ncbi:hypothetical protein [Pectobacterium polaris]|uniref:hypothetical protein n=1 Tax=Pectobacterium polaris TaxID=2042057 RepID=UPI000AE3DCC3|nr:hypothetical protein [Pectobacterium polaris]ASY77281.1 hypothetical protein BJJ97_15810 [Pectobacterium polaris]